MLLEKYVSIFQQLKQKIQILIEFRKYEHSNKQGTLIKKHQ